MTREKANKELAKYKPLVGKFSTNFSGNIDDVFVSFDDQVRARAEYFAIKDKKTDLPPDKPEDEFIVWARFKDAFVPIKYVEMD